ICTDQDRNSVAALTGAERSERQSRYQPRFRYDGVTTFISIGDTRLIVTRVSPLGWHSLRYPKSLHHEEQRPAARERQRKAAMAFCDGRQFLSQAVNLVVRYNEICPATVPTSNATHRIRLQRNPSHPAGADRGGRRSRWPSSD